jgi:hypothetical protein
MDRQLRHLHGFMAQLLEQIVVTAEISNACVVMPLDAAMPGQSGVRKNGWVRERGTRCGTGLGCEDGHIVHEK